MTTLLPAALNNIYDWIGPYLAHERRSGIVNANSPGYHTSREDLIRQGRSNDYSIQCPADRRGNAKMASGIDIGFFTVDEQALVHRRLRAACTPNAAGDYDPRIECVREFIGTLDGKVVSGYNRVATGSASRSRVGWHPSGFSDLSHRTHEHISVLRDRCENDNDMRGLAEVIAGLYPGKLGWKGDWPTALPKPGTAVPVPVPTPTPKPVPVELPTYYVDPKKVTTFLYGVDADEPHTPVKERPPGFKITTADKIVTRDGRQWVQTDAGIQYALDYLTTTAPEPPRPTVTIGTWNVLKTNSDVNMAQGFTQMAADGACIIGVNELSSNAKQASLTKYADSRGWGATKRDSAVTVFYDRDVLELLDEDHVTAHPGGEKWEPGTGGSTSIYKIVMIARFRHKPTGKQIVYLNTHMPPAIEEGGRLRTPKRPKGGVSRIDVYAKQAGALADLIKANRADRLVVGGGDMNVNASTAAGTDLEKRLRNAGAQSVWEQVAPQATHGDRCIDWLWGTRPFTGVRVFPRHGSDHTPVVGTVEL